MLLDHAISYRLKLTFDFIDFSQSEQIKAKTLFKFIRKDFTSKNAKNYNNIDII